MTPRTRTTAVRLLLVGSAYYAGAQLGLSLALYNSQVTPFWPPTGIALAALLVWGRSVWPGVALAAFAVNAPLSDGLLSSAVITLGNVLAPLAAAAVLQRLGFGTRMDRLRDASALVTVGTLAMSISASVGTLGLVLGGLPLSEAGSVALVWWTGDAVGALFVAPFLLTVHRYRHAGPPPARDVVEGGVFLALAASTTAFAFQSPLALPFLVFPVLTAASLRLQVRGAAPTSLVVSLIATDAAADGAGLFHGLSQNEAMLVLQLFNGCIAYTGYLLAALTADRARAQRQLSRQGAALEQQVEQRTEALSAALDTLGEAQRIARMGSFELDARDGTLRWSDELCRLAGLAPGSAVTPALHLELCHPDDVARVRPLFSHAQAGAPPYTFDHRMRQPDGTYRWLHWQGQLVHDSAGRVIGTRGTATDIHDRKQAELRFAQLVEMAPDAMVLVDGEGVITQVNLRTEEMFGYPRGELVGQHLERLIPERFRSAHRQHRARFLAHPGMRPMGPGLELLALRKDGSEFPVEISLSPLETKHGALVSAAIRDVTERKQQQADIEFRGLHDALTGLPNRTLLTDRLTQAVVALQRDESAAVAVLFLDLDHFKWVNDSLGHDAGDLLLSTVAARLQQAVRPEDTVARFGGDEFVVVSSTAGDTVAAPQLAERLRAAVSRPVSLHAGQTVVPTMSIGVTSTTDPDADPATLLREADAAMYRAKDQGRDRTATFAPEIHADMHSRLATAGGLATAIEQGQLRVHYQPIVTLPSGAPRGVEALARWEHPERGLLMPADFITLAEETGQIGALDRAVILLACREFGELVRLRPEARDLTLSVNVSLRHLATTDLRDTLVRGLEEGRLHPHQLTVEVTESAQLPTDQFEALLFAVKALGVRVAIDDFGTGFSALSRLNALKVDMIKVDRTFVSNIHRSRRSQALVAAMAQLGLALDATVVAEGIESEVQAATLQELGCTTGQGFLWSRGLPLDELVRWLAVAQVPRPRPGETGTRARSGSAS